MFLLMLRPRSSRPALLGLTVSLTVVALLLSACGGPQRTSADIVGTSAAGISSVTIPVGTQTASAIQTASPETPLTSPTAAATLDQTTPTALDLAGFQAQVDALVGAAGGLVEVTVAKPDGAMLYEANATEPMESASLYKLAVMVELFRQRDAGLITFDDGIELQPYYFAEGEDAFSEDEIGTAVDVNTLLNAMITLSSNVASTALLEYVGNDNINATMASLGLTGTEIRWMPGPWDLETVPDDSEDTDEPVAPDEGEDSGSISVQRSLAGIQRTGVLFDERADNSLNVTTAADMAALFHLLLAGEVVSPEASQEMLSLLTEQQINDRLPAYLPAGAVVAHKTGNLDALVHDAGVIYAPNGPIIVAVLTEDVDEGVADDLMAQIALLAWQLGI